MKLPIILLVLDEAMAYLYSDIQQVECELEAFDVQNGLYEVYDATAKHLKLAIINKRGIELVKIEEEPIAEVNSPRVCEFLLDSLTYQGITIESEYTDDLAYLIKKYIKHIGFSNLPMPRKQKIVNGLLIVSLFIAIGLMVFKTLNYIDN